MTESVKAGEILDLTSEATLSDGTAGGIEADAITGHSDIAPGRKTDPGPAFDWARLHSLLAG